MDGGLGHGHNSFASKEKDTVGIQRDIIKDRLARNHGVIVVRIDCVSSDCKYIKKNILNKLTDYFDFSVVNWEEIDTKARVKNVYKEICEYYMVNKTPISELMNVFNFGKKFILSALKIGDGVGWCEYKPVDKFNCNNYLQVIDFWNENKNVQTSIISHELNIPQCSVINYLKRGTSEGLCDYDPKEALLQCYRGERNSKTVYVYSKDGCFLNQYKNARVCSENSQSDFGVTFNTRNINMVCNNKHKHHKNYVFSFIPPDDMQKLAV